ncbi:hypothetical protein [Gryllotalpicola koreensis]|uniref:Tryptophan synthase subunit alpha n=1 Tax=Gryllotalpicola koreensis TaxID=993086 RepID=A0ABP8A9S3_9MICO
MTGSEDLETRRREARDELSAIIELKCRMGDDPWEFLPELPSVDEQVVLTMRLERIEEAGLEDERARAYHPTAPHDAAERFEFSVLRGIALDHPGLTRAVWGLLGRLHDAA